MSLRTPNLCLFFYVIFFDKVLRCNAKYTWLDTLPLPTGLDSLSVTVASLFCCLQYLCNKSFHYFVRMAICTIHVNGCKNNLKQTRVSLVSSTIASLKREKLTFDFVQSSMYTKCWEMSGSVRPSHYR